MIHRLKGILFDSGDTLVRPIGGAWWPGPPFEEILASEGVGDYPMDRLDGAIQEGMKYLDENHELTTEDEERSQFSVFYQILLDELGISSDFLAEKLATAVVDGVNIEPFSDTHDSLKRLKQRGLRLGIVSNAWPSLERKFAVLGLREYFDTFVISAQVGCCKPDERIYRKAMEGLELPAENLLFVDDWPGNVRKANGLGLRGVVMARTGTPPDKDLRCVRDLNELESYIRDENRNSE